MGGLCSIATDFKIFKMLLSFQFLKRSKFAAGNFHITTQLLSVSPQDYWIIGTITCIMIQSCGKCLVHWFDPFTAAYFLPVVNLIVRVVGLYPSMLWLFYVWTNRKKRNISYFFAIGWNRRALFPWVCKLRLWDSRLRTGAFSKFLAIMIRILR
jgi:hypothetical protein